MSLTEVPEEAAHMCIQLHYNTKASRGHKRQCKRQYSWAWSRSDTQQECVDSWCPLLDKLDSCFANAGHSWPLSYALKQDLLNSTPHRHFLYLRLIPQAIQRQVNQVQWERENLSTSQVSAWPHNSFKISDTAPCYITTLFIM